MCDSPDRPLRLPPAERAALPHLPAFFPGWRVVDGQAPLALPAGMPAPGGAAVALRYAAGPFRPPPLGSRRVPVLLVVGPAADPIGATLAAPLAVQGAEPANFDLARAVMAAFVAGRLGVPPGLPDAALGSARRRILLDPCEPSRATAALDLQRAMGRHALVLRDPFATGAPVLPGSLPAPDPWALLDAAASLHGASRDLALLALAAGVAVADGPLAGADPVGSWAALLSATRAANPFNAMPCGIPEAMDLLALWRQREAESRRVAVCLGVHPFKRDRLRHLLASAAPPPAFLGTAPAAVAEARRRGGALLAWSASAPAGLRQRCATAGVPLLWLEDGFVRSAGLGAAFRAGASFALDAAGPYYDPAQASELETLLDTAVFAPALLARAQNFRAALVARGITKYNLAGAVPEIAAPAGRRRILVPGQVEDDASVRLGGGAIATNLALLRAVRAAQPDAFLIYKPHPDIEAGFRRGRISTKDLAGLADQVLRDAPMAALFDRVDAVHTLTSLTGFEALLRALPVTCWGTPFYAGWGLTQDCGPAQPRRRRRLSLDELVAGALILYPRCIDPLTELPCPPELLLDRMDRPDLFPPGARSRLRTVQGLVRRSLSRLQGLR